MISLSSCTSQNLEYSAQDAKVCKALTTFMSARQSASDAETAARYLTEVGDSAAFLAREDISPQLKAALLDYNQAIREAVYEYEVEGGATAETLTQVALMSEEVLVVCEDALIQDSVD